MLWQNIIFIRNTLCLASHTRHRSMYCVKILGLLDFVILQFMLLIWWLVNLTWLMHFLLLIIIIILKLVQLILGFNQRIYLWSGLDGLNLLWKLYAAGWRINIRGNKRNRTISMRNWPSFIIFSCFYFFIIIY